MWRVGVHGLLGLVQLTSSWRRGNVPSEVLCATSGGRTPEQSVGAPPSMESPEVERVTSPGRK
ncbi:hypothetical protein TIFTF001_031889 [Ficus carica]|uniref:Secreted protein n=1 Tax=Ficus carica TaxID=3494 RepID=A0AA88E273_FICCA|nr:hypothetical protein TIFTF001_031889 [Ficus carica]